MHNNQPYNKKKLLTAAALLFITAFVAYWQVISFSNCLKWDMVDQYFPWRYHIVACLRDGTLPLWNPYNFAGYPIHADPQSGAWYMPLWLFALFGNYTAHANAVEVFLHIWLAGVGMYLLTHRFYGSGRVALIAAVSYIGCGLLVGNAQHFTYIISACWLPFVLLYFDKALKETGYKNALLLAVFLWLFFTGGYPAFFIITAYILGIAFIIYLIKNSVGAKRLLITISIAGIVFLLLSSPSIVSFALYWNDTTRSGGLSLADALFGAFRVNDMQSFFNPMLSAVKKENTGTDVSMMNGYFGLVPLVFLGLIIPFYKQLGRREVFILIATLICLLAAFGDTFFIPMRAWLFYLPGLGIFRFPAVFRLFAIVGFILLGSYKLSVISYQKIEKKWLLASVSLIAVIVLALSIKNIAWGSIGADFKALRFIWVEFPASSVAALLGGGLQLFFLALIYVFRNNLKALSFIAIANCIVFVQLNISTTVINKENPQVIEDFLAKIPERMAINNSRGMGDTHFEAPAPLWRNLGIFYKELSYDGNNPFRLRNFTLFETSDSVKKYKDIPTISSATSVLEFNKSSCNSFEVMADTKGPGVLTIQHNMAKYWHIEPATIVQSKDEIITNVKLSESTTIVRCSYKPPYVRYVFWMSMVILAKVLFALVMKYPKRKEE